VVETESDHEKEDFEESDENVGIGEGQQEESQKSTDAAVKDRRPDVCDRFSNSFVRIGSGFADEPVCDVNAVVDAQPHRDDQVDAGDCVDGQTPEVHVAGHVDDGENDHGENENGVKDISEKAEGHDEDAKSGQAEISI